MREGWRCWARSCSSWLPWLVPPSSGRASCGSRGQTPRSSTQPDGTRLAIYTDFGPPKNHLPIANGIAILDLASGQITQVVRHEAQIGQDNFPRWSPDGQSIVFWRARQDSVGLPQTAIFIVRAD